MNIKFEVTNIDGTLLEFYFVNCSVLFPLYPNLIIANPVTFIFCWLVLPYLLENIYSILLIIIQKQLYNKNFVCHIAWGKLGRLLSPTIFISVFT